MVADSPDEAEPATAVEVLKRVLESVGDDHPATQAVRSTLVSNHLEDLVERKMTKARIDRLVEDLAARVEEAAG